MEQNIPRHDCKLLILKYLTFNNLNCIENIIIALGMKI